MPRFNVDRISAAILINTNGIIIGLNEWFPQAIEICFTDKLLALLLLHLNPNVVLLLVQSLIIYQINVSISIIKYFTIGALEILLKRNVG